MDEPDNLDPMTSITVHLVCPNIIPSLFFFSWHVSTCAEIWPLRIFPRTVGGKKAFYYLSDIHPPAWPTHTLRRGNNPFVKPFPGIAAISPSRDIRYSRSASCSRTREWADKAVEASSRLPRASKKGQLTRAVKYDSWRELHIARLSIYVMKARLSQPAFRNLAIFTVNV